LQNNRIILRHGHSGLQNNQIIDWVLSSEVWGIRVHLPMYQLTAPSDLRVVIDDKSWQPWYNYYISYLIGPTSIAACHGYRAVSIIYPT